METIGIDAGSTNIKIIAIDETGKVKNKSILKNCNIEQALEKFIEQTRINPSEISKIVLTGIRQKEIIGNIKNIRTVKVDEFEAIGKGATYLANTKNALIISIGTGTAFVKADEGKYTHIGGTGVGGGTLINLCKKLANLQSFNEIEKRIKNADISKIDLRLKDIQKNAINNLLPEEITVANFGKLQEDANNDDITLGILNMVIETIGMMGIFATQNTQNKNIIVIGCITELEYVKKVLDMLSNLQNVNFIIPENSEWAVALGAIQAINCN